MSAVLSAITDCKTTQLNEAKSSLTSNECEDALRLLSGTMLQVTTAAATQMCDIAFCKATMQELYNTLSNCRYHL